LQAERKTFVTVSISFAVHSTYLTALISFARFSPVLKSMGFWLPSSSRTLGSFYGNSFEKKKEKQQNLSVNKNPEKQPNNNNNNKKNQVNKETRNKISWTLKTSW